MLQLNNRLDRAEACLQAIEIIHKEIAKYESEEKRAEIAEKYAEDLAILEREYLNNMIGAMLYGENCKSRQLN